MMNIPIPHQQLIQMEMKSIIYLTGVMDHLVVGLDHINLEQQEKHHIHGKKEELMKYE